MVQDLTWAAFLAPKLPQNVISRRGTNILDNGMLCRSIIRNTTSQDPSNLVLKAIGDSGGPYCWLCNMTSAKTSTPSRRSTPPGHPKSGSANVIPERQREVTSDTKDDYCKHSSFLSGQMDSRGSKTGHRLYGRTTTKTSNSSDMNSLASPGQTQVLC